MKYIKKDKIYCALSVLVLIISITGCTHKSNYCERKADGINGAVSKCTIVYYSPDSKKDVDGHWLFEQKNIMKKEVKYYDKDGFLYKNLHYRRIADTEPPQTEGLNTDVKHDFSLNGNEKIIYVWSGSARSDVTMIETIIRLSNYEYISIAQQDQKKDTISIDTVTLNDRYEIANIKSKETRIYSTENKLTQVIVSGNYRYNIENPQYDRHENITQYEYLNTNIKAIEYIITKEYEYYGN